MSNEAVCRTAPATPGLLKIWFLNVELDPLLHGSWNPTVIWYFPPETND